MTSRMCTGIRFIHCWIRGYSNSFHVSCHAWVAVALEIGAPFVIIALFR